MLRMFARLYDNSLPRELPPGLGHARRLWLAQHYDPVDTQELQALGFVSDLESPKRGDERDERDERDDEEGDVETDEGGRLLSPEEHDSHPVSGWLRSRPRCAWRGLPRPLRWALIAVKLVVIAFVSLLILVAVVDPSYTRPPPHYGHLRRRCQESGFAPGCANPLNEKVFITSILYDPDGSLAGGRWGQRLVELITLLGPDNAFLSIYESDSGRKGEDALIELGSKVPCRHRIVSEEAASLAGYQNVTLPDGTQRTKRVSYLAELRNIALRPLDRFSDEDGYAGRVKFDKVLFLNDIAFEPMDAAQLLFSTNRGRGGRAAYLAACAVDFDEAFKMYDNYALRDADGLARYLNLFPFFSRDGRALSRADVLAQRDAVRVKSCWGGMITVQARYVQNYWSADLPRPGFQDPGAHVIDPDDPGAGPAAPVRFRHEPEPFYDACEACLFAADVAAVAAREEQEDGEDGGEEQKKRRHAKKARVYVNPYVRVAYSDAVLAWLPVVKRVERPLVVLYELMALFARDAPQPYLAVGEGDAFAEEAWDGERGAWRLVPRRGRSGLFCGVRGMQTLRRDRHYEGRNWLETRLPPGQVLAFPTMGGRVLPETWREDYLVAPPEERESFFEFDPYA